jgi:hypothetical protein
MHNSGLAEGSLVINHKASIHCGFEDLQIEAEINLQLIRTLRIIRLKLTRWLS